MKKLLIIIFIITSIHSVLLASDRSSNLFTILEVKEGKPEEVNLYNVWIKDYNKFKGEFDFEVFDFCEDQMISSGGAGQLTKQTKCFYHTATDLARKYNLHHGDFASALYTYHKHLFPLAKTTALNIIQCGYGKSCTENYVDQYISRMSQIETKLFNNLDRIIINLANEDQAKIIAIRKEKKKNNIKLSDKISSDTLNNDKKASDETNSTLRAILKMLR